MSRHPTASTRAGRGTSRSRSGLPVLLAVLLVSFVGCASGGGRPGEGLSGATTSEEAVHAFLEGVRRGDYQLMGAHFGTVDGPARKRLGIAEVEQRMIFLARLLRHSSYDLRVANLAQLGPDRVRYVARLEGTRRGDVLVPIVTVPARDGHWYVERLDVDALTASPGR